MATPRTTVDRHALLPALYDEADSTGVWAGVLSIFADTINDLLSSPDTRAFLDAANVGSGAFDTVLEASTEGGAGLAIQVALEVVSTGNLSITVDLAAEIVSITATSGITTVGDVEDAIAALDGPDAIVRVQTPGTRSRTLSLTDGFAATALVGASPAGYVLGTIAVDAMRRLRDPTKTEAKWLPYLGQGAGLDLDLSLRESLLRKILSLAEQRHKLRGTKAGIVAALQLLFGFSVVYDDWWADGWELGSGVLGQTTRLAPPLHAPGWSRGSLVAPVPSALQAGSTLAVPSGDPAEPLAYEFQQAPSIAGDYAEGWIRVCDPGQLQNNMTLTVPARGGGVVTFEFWRDANFVQADPSSYVVNALGATADAVATVLAATLESYAASLVCSNVTRAGTTIRLRASSVGTASNLSLGGSVFELFDGLGLIGGTATGGTYEPTGANAPINLQGTQTADDVARLLRHRLAFDLAATTDVTRTLLEVDLRALTKGVPDAPIVGTAAAALSASGMVGGVGLNPDVLTFSITFPRHLDPDEINAAIRVIEEMKSAPTHYRLVNPPAEVAGMFILDDNFLGSASVLSALAPPDAVDPPVSYAADPWASYSGRTFSIVLDPVTSARSRRLLVGACYQIEADDDCYVRGGNPTVVATSDDMLLPADVPMVLTPQTPRDCYIAALRAVDGGGAARLRVTRLDA